MGELLLAFALGSFMGIISGVIPGLNIFVSVLLFFPLIVTWEPTSIMFMYITLASVNQYFGSVSATIFAMPGSTTSIPALHEGHSMFQNGQGDKAIMFAAIGSFVASMFAVLLIQVSLPMLQLFYQMFNTHIQVVLLSIAIATIVYFSGNKLLTSIILFLVGNILAFVGWHEEYGTQMSFGTFGISALYTGIPLLPVMIALFVLPIFAKNWNTHTKIKFKGVTLTGYWESAKEMIKMKWTLARSSLIGAVAGFVPGISWGLSTIVAYNVERMYRIRKKEYNSNGDVHSLVSAESANNAGIYTSMIPLLFAGIPITASTALIYNILLFKGVEPTVEFFQGLYGTVTVGFVFSSLIGLFVAGKYVNFLKVLQGLDVKWFYSVIFTLLIIVCYVTGQTTYSGVDNLVILACLIPFGYLIRDLNTMPLIYGFILNDIFLENFTRLWYFY
jgi:putative tricarboxylic transport membrane protein